METPSPKKQTRDLCAEYGVSSMTIWRWVKAGILPKPDKIQGRNYWPHDVKPLTDNEVA